MQIKEIFQTAVPAWISAVGTLAIAVVAWITLDPLVENLNLRSENVGLRVQLDDLNRQTKESESALSIAKMQRVAAESQLERFNADLARTREDTRLAQRELSATRAHTDRLLEMSAKTLETLNERDEERRKLQEQNKEIRVANAVLDTENVTLQKQNVALAGERDKLISSLSDAHREVARVRHSQRVFVIDSILQKARTLVPNPSTGFKKFVELNPKGEWPTVTAAVSTLMGAFLSEPPPRRTGREVLRSLYEEPEFDLFTEQERQSFVAKIEKFMNVRKEEFDQPLGIDFRIGAEFGKASRHVTDLRTAQNKQTRVEVEKGKPERVPTDQDIKQAEDMERPARELHEKEIQRATRVVEEFHSALDEMKASLTDPT